jgi:hypothetical protein
MSSTPTDLDGLRRLIALKTSESETGANDKNSDDNNKITHLQFQAMKFDSIKIRSYDHLLKFPARKFMGSIAFYCWIINFHYLQRLGVGIVQSI